LSQNAHYIRLMYKLTENSNWGVLWKNS